MSSAVDLNVRIFSTCPQSKDFPPDEYKQAVVDVARWSESAGCAGILVYADNGIVDPWLVAQLIVQSTTQLSPLVAVQPVYMHPYTAAKLVASLGHMYGRRIFINMIAGGFKNDLTALNDPTPHDERYERLIEYTMLMNGLLTGDEPMSFSGKYYRVTNLRMTPALHPDLAPEFLISGSSEAGLAAARSTGATPVRYPEPPGEHQSNTSDLQSHSGVRVGIITRETSEEAWSIAHERFPEDRRGQIAHHLAMKVSDSKWHEQLSKLGAQPTSERNPYWLTPFQNYKTFCPYLVGSHQEVARELSRYIANGVDTFILDIPSSRTELEHIGVVFDLAASGARA